METQEIKLKVISRSHNRVVLKSDSGNTFTFDPTKRLGEELYDFLFY